MQKLESINENVSALKKGQSQSVGYGDEYLATSSVAEQFSASVNDRLSALEKRMEGRSLPSGSGTSQDVRLLS